MLPDVPELGKPTPELEEALRWQGETSALCFAILSLLNLQYEHEGHFDEVVFAHLLELMNNAGENITRLLGGLFPEDIPF